MKDLSKYTIKDIEAIFAGQEPDEELLVACRADSRKAAGALVRRYERQQKEHQRVAALYKPMSGQPGSEAWKSWLVWMRLAVVRWRLNLGGGAVILPHDLYLPVNDSQETFGQGPR